MKALQKGIYEDREHWLLFIAPVAPYGILAAYSDGSLKVFPPTAATSALQPLRVIKAHDSTINGLKAIGNDGLIATCAEDKIRIWDLKSGSDAPVRELTNDRASKYLSLGFGHGLLAAGTELQGVDAEVHIWDLDTGKLVRKFVDSHHDDVTDVKFHPTNRELLLSGSTDGYVNIYDLSIEDEEDALHQVINFASVHSASFISPYRISTLSHMETFAIHDLEKDKSEDLTAPKPLHDFGDVRSAWDCEYVIDVFPGYVACGSNSLGHLMVYPFNQQTEKVDTDSPIFLLGGHGEEVVRAIHVDGANGLIYTGGEDGCFRIWETLLRLPTLEEFFQADHENEVEMEIDAEVDDGEERKKKKKKKDREHKKDKKDKVKKDKTKKKKKKKKLSDVRFKPY